MFIVVQTVQEPTQSDSVTRQDPQLPFIVFKYPRQTKLCEELTQLADEVGPRGKGRESGCLQGQVLLCPCHYDGDTHTLLDLDTAVHYMCSCT